MLFGPVIGSALLPGLGPTAGIFANVAFYLPLTLFLFRTKFTGHTRDDRGRGSGWASSTLCGCCGRSAPIERWSA